MAPDQSDIEADIFKIAQELNEDAVKLQRYILDKQALILILRKDMSEADIREGKLGKVT